MNAIYNVLPNDGLVAVCVQFVRQFYIAQWYRDCTMEAEKAAKKISDDSSLRKAAEMLAKKQQVNGNEKSDDEDDDDDDDGSPTRAALKKAAVELEAVKELQRKAETRKTFLMQLIAARIGAGTRIKYLWAAALSLMLILVYILKYTLSPSKDVSVQCNVVCCESDTVTVTESIIHFYRTMLC